MVARIVDKFGMSIEQAGKLTPWQVKHILGAPRDKEGSIIDLPPKAGEPSDEEWTQNVYRSRGLPEYLVIRKLKAMKENGLEGDGPQGRMMRAWADNIDGDDDS